MGCNVVVDMVSHFAEHACVIGITGSNNRILILLDSEVVQMTSCPFIFQTYFSIIFRNIHIEP